jgi:type II secretory pathway component PulM
MTETKRKHTLDLLKKIQRELRATDLALVKLDRKIERHQVTLEKLAGERP